MGRVTIKEVAAKAGFSIATVSYVMNGKGDIPKTTADTILAVVKELGYVSNYSARSLVMKKSNLIGVIIPQTEPGSCMVFENPFYSEFLSSVEYNARINGYHVIVSGSNADEKYFQLAQQRNLDGIIIIGTYQEEFFEDFKKMNIPLVLVDSYLENHQFHSIRLNDRNAGYVATKHLLEKGHRAIAIMSGALKVNGVNEMRFQGYKDALKEYGVKFNRKYVLSDKTSFESGRNLAKKLLGEIEVTAVFCTADIIAMGALKTLNGEERLVPDKIAIVGIDNLNIASYCIPGLTTIGQDVYKKGEKSVQMILNQIESSGYGKQEYILPTQLIERESVIDVNR